MDEIPPIIKLAMEERTSAERERSDAIYAIKLVERIVFAILGAISLGFLYALIKFVIVTPNVL